MFYSINFSSRVFFSYEHNQSHERPVQGFQALGGPTARAPHFDRCGVTPRGLASSLSGTRQDLRFHLPWRMLPWRMAFAASRSRQSCVTNLGALFERRVARHVVTIVEAPPPGVHSKVIGPSRHNRFLQRAVTACRILTSRLRCSKLLWRVLQADWRAALVIDPGKDPTLYIHNGLQSQSDCVSNKCRSANVSFKRLHKKEMT